MGVTCLLHWQPAHGEALSLQTYGDVRKAIDGLPSASLQPGKWKIVCSFLRPILREAPGGPSRDQQQQQQQQPARDLFTVDFSATPGRLFAVLRSERLVMEADGGFQALMDKLQLYRTRVAVSYEGVEYVVGDVVMRVGCAELSTTFNLRGIVVEIELQTTSSMERARPMMNEFLRLWHDAAASSSGLNGRFVPLEPNYSEFGLGAMYSQQHMALQYVLVSAHLMAAKGQG